MAGQESGGQGPDTSALSLSPLPQKLVARKLLSQAEPNQDPTNSTETTR